MKSLPSVSVVIACFNSQRTIDKTLASIKAQKYPRQKVEIIIADGGSTDQTEHIARRYGARWVDVDKNLQSAEYNKAVGISQATGDIIAMIDHDNVLPNFLWLSRMVQPFVDDPSIVGAETLRYMYVSDAPLLDRYFALFGSGDPVVWYLGKTDRLSYMYDQYRLSGTVIRKKPYYVVRFTEENMPTIGANGFLVRRDILMKYAYTKPGEYFDMDVNIDLIRSGHNTYAFVDEGIIHNTGYGSVWYYFARRMLFMRQYHVSNVPVSVGRRFHMVSGRNIPQLMWAIVASISIVVPLFESIRGWRKVRDPAWFLHPVMAVGFVFTYAWVIIEHRYRSYAATILGK